MSDLDRLYEAYLSTGDVGPLLTGIRRKALAITRDDDVAQTFSIGVWQALPTLTIRSSFTAWVNRRLRWRSDDAHRAMQRRCEEPLPEEVIGETGDTLPDLSVIADDTIRDAAELMQEGFTQEETAGVLGMQPATLRQKLNRFRRSFDEQ